MVNTQGDTTKKASSLSALPRSQGSSAPLYVQYPVGTLWEMTLAPCNEKVQGRVYCTDETSQVVVLCKALVHTAVAAEVRLIHASGITNKKRLPDKREEDNDNDQNIENNSKEPSGALVVSSSSSGLFSSSLPKVVNKKALEEREKRAIRMAEDSFRHINQKATPQGQVIFDRLLKACNEVVWEGESILVLNQIKVDPPYGKDDCKLIQSHQQNRLQDSSLDRVKKIVMAAAAAASNNNGSP